ncbi:hypothetical protein K7I13_11080 [Brucepastera parasyntrophica]|uniref:hypothetical protein n=1 Tax=Brucepastera parasyntrophica TaxID=2880008 RepID=UPI0021093128|nr:hypothetical protein [Brucepastera parasyntrophica]ULQ59051.1 hypothetical protein K7I13_11080 [Brucepastera parasyntrophica]
MERHACIADVRLEDEKWTLKEMVSHLIDSASNNHQRFIRLQLETALEFPAYDAEEWKNTSKISSYSYTSLISLWKEYNAFLLHILTVMDEKKLDNTWIVNGQKLTLRFIAEDYFGRHMEWHIALFDERVREINSGCGTDA